MTKLLLSGNEAAAHGAYEAGVHVAAAYPGTPSTEILETIAKFPEVDAEWSPNEKVAFEVALGAAIAGARAMVSMKHVGLNVAADPFFSASYTGVNGGLVVITADDPGMHSSQNEQDNRRYGKFAKVPVIEPSDPQEVYEFIQKAFDISEEFDTPVLFRLTTRISHTKGVVVASGERKEVPVKPYKKDIEKYVIIPSHARKRHYVVEERTEKLREFANRTELNRIEWRDTDLGIITDSVAYQYAREVFPNASILKLGLVWPFPVELAREFRDKVKRLYVIEELEPFIEEELRFYGIHVDVGKDKVPMIEELTPSRVRVALTGVELPHPEPQKSVIRPPALCPGCPHTGVFFNLAKLRAHVTGDIGCYTLGVLPPLSAMDTTICMGASVGNAFGFEKAQGKKFAKKTVGVIGDSTFLHNGITGLIDIVYNKGISTIVILDNRTTAMTGHQPHPATGKTAKGEETQSIDFEKLVRAIGINHVTKVDPHDLKATYKALKNAMEAEEPAVVIAERACALLPEERKAAAKRPKKYIDAEACRGDKCHLCLRLGCPAIGVDENLKAKIDPLLCVGCELCIQTCPFDAIHPEEVK